MDEPKSLHSVEARAERLTQLDEAHIAPLSDFVRRLRAHMGDEYKIPYFDPLDGGTEADCLFLLEAPGAKAVASGFISRNNPDETAKNFFLLLQAAKIDRRRTVLWNIIPWYIGTGVRIREATATDIRTAEPALHELATLLPRVRTVVLVGRKASNKKTQWLIGDLFPAVRIFSIFHPSPLYINNAPGNRDVLLQQLGEVAASLPPWAPAA